MTDAERDLLFGIAEMLSNTASPQGQAKLLRLVDMARPGHCRLYLQFSERYVDATGATISLASLPDTPG